MNLKDIPNDSLIRPFAQYMGATEVPVSYQIAGALSALGAVLRRNRYVDQVDWRVYPNQSILFIGPSGVGKDTIINRIGTTMTTVEAQCRVPTLAGCTIELIHARLAQLGKPACAFIPAPEITAFFGKADYQANMLTGITNLLSNGEKVDISTKGSYTASGGQATIISQPTITMHAGSTVEWLHKGMPDGTLEGGFLGRFLIVIEEFGGKFIPLVKQGRTRADIEAMHGQMARWYEGLGELITACKTPREMILLPEAEDSYTNWYYNRFKMFSKAVMPYANRSRDMVLRLAMLMALSRGHTTWIEKGDVEFAIGVLREIAGKIDRVVLPPAAEAQVADQILKILPATMQEIYMALGVRYSIPKAIDPAFDLLRRTGKIVSDGRIIRGAEEAQG